MEKTAIAYNYYYWNQPNGPKEKLDAIAEDMLNFMLNQTSFGRYCHEGGDLVSDFIHHVGDVSLNDDEHWGLEHLAEKIVDEFETSQCGFCNKGENDD